MNVHIRWLIRRDMPEVLEISRLSNRPWGEGDFLAALRQRNVIGMVAEVGETVVGFMVYELHKSRIELLQLAVHPSWRKREVGRQLLLKLESKLSQHRRRRAFVSVDEGDLGTQLFLRSCGWKAREVVRSRGEPDVFRFRREVSVAAVCEV